MALDPQFADAYFALGHAYFDLKRWAEAADRLERAIELNPKDVEAQDRLSFARTMLQPYGGGTKPVPKPLSRPKEQPVASKSRLPPNSHRRVRNQRLPADVEDTENKTNDDELALTRIYKIGPNDVLDIRVADPATSSQSTLFTVTSAGFLEHLLLAEPMPVGGLTAEEVTARIETDLKRRALDSTKITVSVRDYASHAILVSGLVKDAGTKILRREAIPLYVVTPMPNHCWKPRV